MDTDQRVAPFKYECLLFDMDDTLYPLSVGLNLVCRKNIQDYMLEHLHIEESEVPKMCLDLYIEYGTTMAGLKALGYEFDNDEFHAYVHGTLPYEKLKPDPVLRNLLLSMPQRKIVFTNADQAHAVKVLNRLGLEDCFEGIICFETLNPPKRNGCMDVPQDNNNILTENALLKNSDNLTDNGFCASHSHIICKPSMEAFEAAIQIANVDPKKTVTLIPYQILAINNSKNPLNKFTVVIFNLLQIFFDDSTRNVATGKAAGLQTVIVGRSELMPGADHALSSIHNIKEAVPEIWEVEEGNQKQRIQSQALEAMVLA